MEVNLSSPNPALESVFADPNQIITLDANFLIPPDRSRLTRRGFDFLKFQHIWLDPIFKAFPNVAIHEAVYDELVLPSVRSYAQAMLESTPPHLMIHRDSNLKETERVLRDSVEEKIYPFTKYDPRLDNRDDRGEVKSLAYMAVKGLLYFAAHDSNAIQLVEKAEGLSTGLDNIRAIKMYELIFYLCVMRLSERQSLKLLYKYQYYLTNNEKRSNPEWGQFLTRMESMYHVSPEDKE